MRPTVFWTTGVAAALAIAACSAGEDGGDADETQQPEGSGESSGSGAAEGTGGGADTTTGGGTSSGGTDGGTGDDEPSDAFDAYETSCEEEACSADERCAEVRTGTSCLHECPGQPCPPGAAGVSFCDRQGGVTCLEE